MAGIEPASNIKTEGRKCWKCTHSHNCRLLFLLMFLTSFSRALCRHETMPGQRAELPGHEVVAASTVWLVQYLPSPCLHLQVLCTCLPLSRGIGSVL